VLGSICAGYALLVVGGSRALLASGGLPLMPYHSPVALLSGSPRSALSLPPDAFLWRCLALLAAGRRGRASPALGRGRCAARRGARNLPHSSVAVRAPCLPVIYTASVFRNFTVRDLQRPSAPPAPFTWRPYNARASPFGSSPRMAHVEVTTFWALCVCCVGMQRGRTSTQRNSPALLRGFKVRTASWRPQ